MRTRIIVFTLIFNAILWGVLASMPAGTVQAQSGCPAAYVVQPGDWLAAIARRFNTTVDELLRLNPQLYARMNLIFPGEILCIPAQPAPPAPTPPVPTGFLSLEVEYTRPTVPTKVTLQAPMTSLGKRIPLALQAGDATTFITSTDQITSTLSGQPAPLMLAIRNGTGTEPPSDQPPDFTLFEVGSSNILSSLQLTPTLPLALTPGCDGHPLNEAFGIAASQPMTLTAWLEGEDGSRFPFRISQVGVVPAASVSTCSYNSGPLKQNLLAFALLPGDSAQPAPPYRLILHAYSTGGPCDGCDTSYICEALGPWGEYVCWWQ
jgi:hypothetical protein